MKKFLGFFRKGSLLPDHPPARGRLSLVLGGSVRVLAPPPPDSSKATLILGKFTRLQDWMTLQRFSTDSSLGGIVMKIDSEYMARFLLQQGVDIFFKMSLDKVYSVTPLKIIATRDCLIKF